MADQSRATALTALQAAILAALGPAGTNQLAANAVYKVPRHQAQLTVETLPSVHIVEGPDRIDRSVTSTIWVHLDVGLQIVTLSKAGVDTEAVAQAIEDALIKYIEGAATTLLPVGGVPSVQNIFCLDSLQPDFAWPDTGEAKWRGRVIRIEYIMDL